MTGLFRPTIRGRVGAVAQLVERVVRNDEASGSIPLGSTIDLRGGTRGRDDFCISVAAFGPFLVNGLLLLAAAGAVPAASVPSAPKPGYTQTEERQVYQPVYFQDIAPQTAADMLYEIPGFSVRRSGGGRGLGQGGTNVLIDGQRVSGKGNDPVDILQRTSAEAVLRIEIVDAARLGIPGLSGQVADVKLSQTGMTGRWAWRPTFRTRLEPDWYNGAASISGRLGTLDYTLGFDNGSYRSGSAGPELLVGPEGAIIEEREEDARWYGDRPSFTLTIGWDRENGHDANLTAGYARNDTDGRERRDILFADGSTGFRDYQQQEREWNGELGGDYSLDALAGRLKIIGIQSFEHSPTSALLLETGPEGFSGGDLVTRTVDEGESILRGELFWQTSDISTLEAALEGAFNFLDSETFTTDITEAGIFVPDAAGLDTARVEELRGQASLAFSRPLGSVDLQLSLGLEASELSQPGTGLDPRVFVRPKGYVSAAYGLTSDTDLRLRVEKRVGQLNFFDFVSSVDLNSDNQSLGNPDLAPSQTWLTEGQVEQRFGDEAQVTLRAYYERIQDVVQRIPLSETADGPGNLEQAEVWGAAVNGSFPTEEFSLPGGEIDFSASFRESTLDDPITLTSRAFSGDQKWAWGASFRHDVPGTPYAYGFGANDRREAPRFRFSEVVRRFDEPFAYVFAEHRDFIGTRLKVTLGNVFDRTNEEERIIYGGRRDLEPVTYSELRERNSGANLRVEISDTF